VNHNPFADVVCHEVFADDDWAGEITRDLGQKGVAVGGRGDEVSQHEGTDGGLGGDLADLGRQRVIARHVGLAGFHANALDNRHVMVDEDLVEKQIGALRGLDQGVTAPGGAGDH